MALGDITLFGDQAQGLAGARKFKVVSGTSASINAGEPVVTTLGAAYVAAMATNKPVSGTDYVVGIAATTSTETTTAHGYVDVYQVDPNQVWLIKPNVAATFDTQSEYDALVGDRVVLDLTSSSWTILAADGATYGCVIMPLDVVKHPGKVAFSFRRCVQWMA
jgi:hypothetical protein